MSFRRIIVGSFALAGLVAFRAAPEDWLPQFERLLGASEASKSTLSRIGGVAVDRVRNVAVSQPDSARVLVFRPDGSTLTAVGKRGTGPGEFLTVGDIGRIGDTLWVIDDRNPRRRFHLYGPDYRYVGTAELRLPPFKPKALPPVQLALLQNGYVLSQVPTEMAVGTTDIVTSTRSGTGARTLAVIKRSRTALHLPAFNVTQMFPELSLLDDYALARVIPGGGGVIVIDRTAAAKIGPATYSITQYKPDGTVAWKRQYPYTAIPVGTDFIEGPIDRAADDITKAAGSKAKALDIIRKGIGPLPTTIPAVDNFMVGADGTIWLTGPGVATPQSWAVLDPSGTQIATAVIPGAQALGAAQRGLGWLVSMYGNRWVLGQYKFQPKK